MESNTLGRSFRECQLPQLCVTSTTYYKVNFSARVSEEVQDPRWRAADDEGGANVMGSEGVSVPDTEDAESECVEVSKVSEGAIVLDPRT